MSGWWYSDRLSVQRRSHCRTSAHEGGLSNSGKSLGTMWRIRVDPDSSLEQYRHSDANRRAQKGGKCKQSAPIDRRFKPMRSPGAAIIAHEELPVREKRPG